MRTRCFVMALALLVCPSISDACDWLAPNDVFTMAQSSPRVSLVTAQAQNQAKVVRDLKGSGPTILRTGRTNCDPHFQTRGASYLLFHGGKGQAVSDSSAALLIGDAGKRTLAAVEGFLRLASQDQRLFVERIVIGELSSGGEVAAFRLISDGIRFLGKAPAAVAAKYPPYVSAVRKQRSGYQVRATKAQSNFFTLMSRAKLVAVIRSGKIVSTLRTVPQQTLKLRPNLVLSKGAQYLVLANAQGELIAPPLLLAGSNPDDYLVPVRAFLRAKNLPDKRAAVEDFLVKNPSIRWTQELVDAWAWLVDSRRRLQPATCAAKKKRGTPSVDYRVRSKWKRVALKHLCRS